MDLSVVIPAYNEESNLQPLLAELKPVLAGLGKTYEIIVVDDGSADGTFTVLRRLKKDEKALTAIRHRRNFGQTAALATGFSHAKGNLVAVIDADMQNDPQDIPRLIGKLSEGYDVVSGWRYQRKDPFLKIFVSRLANGFRRLLTAEKVHDSGCSLKVYKKECLEDLPLYGETHRFIPLLLAWKGFKIGELKVNHRPRKSGRTKYGIVRIMKGFLDLITIKFWVQYSTRPMHLFGSLGLLSFFLGLILSIYLAAMKLLYGIPLANRPLLLLSILLIVLGVQLFALGLLADILIKMYFHNEGGKQKIEAII